MQTTTTKDAAKASVDPNEENPALKNLEILMAERREDIRQRCQAAGVTHIHQWEPIGDRVLIGKLLVTAVADLEKGDKPVEKLVYLEISHLEWQVREAIKDDRATMLLAKILIEE